MEGRLSEPQVPGEVGGGLLGVLARHWRDLGSHARTDAREIGVTAACRVSKASVVIPSITGLPAGRWLLNRVLVQKCLAMALYGAEATPLPERTLQQLRGAFLGVVKAQCGLCATAAMVFQECATRGFELDPELLVALNRIDMARKVWHKMPSLRRTMANIWDCYQTH